jgi:hypothetical protein
MLARPVAIPVAMVPGRTHSLGAMSKLRPANQSRPSRRRGPKPDRRRALELLAVLLGRLHWGDHAGAHGFTAEQMVELVHAGLATARAERVVTGGRAIEVARVRITEAGRRALIGGSNP